MFCGISCKSSDWPRNGRLTFFPLLDNLQGLKTEEKNILQLETVIGEGAYGVVRRGYWDGLPVAVKTLKSDNDQSNLAEAYLLR